MARLSIIVPCCNEEDAIERLSARLFPALEPLARRYALELVFVDDGSTDATWSRLEQLQQAAPWPVVLARHQPNRGLGAALRTGQAQATGELVVTLDADGTYPFTIVEPLVAAIERGADIATASPYHRAGGVAGVSGLRLFFSRGASLCYRLLVDRRIATYTAMVRAYRVGILAAALPEEPGFLHVAMALVEARRRGARIVEVPAVLARREVGVSKAKIARITRAHLAYMRRLLLLRATGRFWLAPRAVQPADALEVVRHG
jgi:dolichol-phosphate mannosyltransferase